MADKADALRLPTTPPIPVPPGPTAELVQALNAALATTQRHSQQLSRGISARAFDSRTAAHAIADYDRRLGGNFEAAL